MNGCQTENMHFDFLDLKNKNAFVLVVSTPSFESIVRQVRSYKNLFMFYVEMQLLQLMTSVDQFDNLTSLFKTTRVLYRAPLTSHESNIVQGASDTSGKSVTLGASSKQVGVSGDFGRSPGKILSFWPTLSHLPAQEGFSSPGSEVLDAS